jgi:hypothetical protein
MLEILTKFSYNTEDDGILIASFFACASLAFFIGRFVFGNPKLKAPRIGKDPHGFFALAKARADFLINGRKLAEDGYSKVSDCGTASRRLCEIKMGT